MTATNLATFVGEVARANAESGALAMGRVRLTYGQLMTEVAAMAGGLRAAGARPGDRVLVFADNGPSFFVAFLACARLGCVLTSAYGSFVEEELRYILDNAEPRVALVAADKRERFDACLDHGPSDLSVFEIAPEGVRGLPDSEPVHEDASVEADTGVLITYTSGTTSRPKPVFHGHLGLVGATKAHRRVWRVTPADRILVAVPVAWIFGSVTIGLTGLGSGAQLVMTSRFNPVEALAEMSRERVTFFPGVGTMFAMAVDADEQHGLDADLSSLRLAVAAGEARNEEQLQRFRERFGCPVHDAYAASECLPFATYDPELTPEPRPGCGGQVVPEADFRLLDTSGRDVPAGEVGELWIRGVGSMLGYFREPELTAEAMTPDGWYRTKDLCRIDEDRYLYAVGRSSDMIIRGGTNVSPVEVERVLLERPGVREAAVVGVPDPKHGERVVAFVAAEPEIELESGALREECRRRLADYKVPAVIQVMPELPKSPTGKVLKKELRCMAAL